MRTLRARFTLAVLSMQFLPTAPSFGEVRLSLPIAEDCPGGIAAFLGGSTVKEACALARARPFVVQILLRSAQRTAEIRNEISQAGLYGKISVTSWNAQRLPYAENLLSVVVVAEPAHPPWEEVFRVLHPRGVLLIQLPQGARAAAQELTAELKNAGFKAPRLIEKNEAYLRAEKGVPPAIDQWTHWRHGPDGNPVSRDYEVGPPAHLQWVAGPLYLRSHDTDSSVSMVITGGGGIYAFVDEGVISCVGNHSLPDKWFLVARNAFNGVCLWKIPIAKWGWRQWKHSWFSARPGDIPLNRQMRLVYSDGRLYVTLGYDAPVSVLNSRTGTLLRTIPGSEGTREILCTGRVLLLAVPTALTRGAPCRVAAYDAETGEKLWQSEKAFGGTTADYIRWKESRGGIRPPVLDPALNLATSEDTVALIDRTDIVALSKSTGKETWRVAVAENGKPLYLGALIVNGPVVLYADQRNLRAFSAGTGRLLWRQPKTPLGHLWYEWKDVFVIDGIVWTWSERLKRGVVGARRNRWPESLNGYDLRTGKLVKTVPLGSVFNTHHHHRCYRDTATPRYILASRRGTEYIDLHGNEHTIHNYVRGTCHVGMLPANGLQYAPPHPCRCYIREKLNGFLALAPRRTKEERPALRTKAHRGPAFEDHLKGPHADPSCDWPTYRRDNRRSGATGEVCPTQLTVLWNVKLGKKLSPPIAVGGSVYLSCVEEHQVLALNAGTGEVKWRFFAGARIDSPPTYQRGDLLFGARDGCLYCLRASDGTLAWRYQAVGPQRQVAAFGQLESAWPLCGSVLVEGTRAYAVAGRSSHLDGGLAVCALHLRDGSLSRSYRFSGPSYSSTTVNQNFKLPEGALPDCLLAGQGKLYMRGWAFDPELTKAEAAWGPIGALGGFLDGSYFQRAHWYFLRPNNFARLLVYDRHGAFLLRMFERISALDPKHFFTPGADGYILLAQDPTGRRTVWKKRIPIRVRAMALTARHLIVAGPPDMIDPKDPLGAFEGRKGGILAIFKRETGEEAARYQLPSPPVFDGLIVQRGRVLLATRSGRLLCFVKRRR